MKFLRLRQRFLGKYCRSAPRRRLRKIKPEGLLDDPADWLLNLFEDGKLLNPDLFSRWLDGFTTLVVSIGFVFLVYLKRSYSASLICSKTRVRDSEYENVTLVCFSKGRWRAPTNSQ